MRKNGISGRKWEKEKHRAIVETGKNSEKRDRA
jgi:hypothetical protein